MRMRQPIVAVLGHVDSGKTSLLDSIRGTGVQGREAGGMTQHIGASFLPQETIRARCGPLYDRLAAPDGARAVPGVLVIDTPGHEVFTNLRARGGSAADIAILVVDAARGMQPQTRESLGILRDRKVPFVVALNKIDQISGWRAPAPAHASAAGGGGGEDREGGARAASAYASAADAVGAQDESVRADLDQKLYDVVGSLSVLGYKSESFDRVRDFAREVCIVPTSARSGTGVPELLAVLVGLTQQYLAARLDQDAGGEARGIVLEVNDEVGIGPSANVILADGTLSMGDTVVAARRGGVVAARPKAILLPRPLDEMRDPRDRFAPVESVSAAAGVKIASPDLDGVLPGSTMLVAPAGAAAAAVAELRGRIEAEMRSVFVETEADGVTVRCDTIGSLEAVVSMLSQRGVAVARADIGPVTRRDVIGARAVKDNDRHLGVVIAFNVRVLPDAAAEADESSVRVFSGRVIYSLVDSYTEWARRDALSEEDSVFAEITPVAKFTFLSGFVFRNNDPAVFGVRVDAGRLVQKAQFINDAGRRVGRVHQLQEDKKTVPAARRGAEVACSVQGVTVGRQVNEGDVFYSLPTSREAKELLGRFAGRLDEGEAAALARVVELQRDRDPAYGY